MTLRVKSELSFCWSTPSDLSDLLIAIAQDVQASADRESFVRLVPLSQPVRSRDMLAKMLEMADRDGEADAHEINA